MLSQCECYPIFHQEDYQGSNFLILTPIFHEDSRDRSDEQLQAGQHGLHEAVEILHLQGGGSVLLLQDYQQNVHLQTGTHLVFIFHFILNKYFVKPITAII